MTDELDDYTVTVEPRELAAAERPRRLADVIGGKLGWQAPDLGRNGPEPDGYCHRCEREHACCRCDDGGWLRLAADPDDGRPVRVERVPNREPVFIAQCDCRWKAPRRPFDARRFGFPERLADVRIATWPGGSNTRPAIVAANYALEWPPRMPNLVFLGDVGRGKTGLACAIVREVYERHGIAGRVVTEARLLDRLRASFDEEAVERTDDVVQEYLRCPLLVVDDLGTSKPTEWVVDRVFAIIGGRLNAGAPTILTANNRTQDGSGWPRVDPRVKSRAMDASAGQWLEFDGPDYRMRRAG